MSLRLSARWRLGWLLWRHGWRLRFAHHPLCERFHAKVWRLGGLHLCVGCCCLAAGAIAGLGLGAPLLAQGRGAALVAAGLAVAALAIPLSWPPWYRRLPPALHACLRFLAGLLVASPVLLVLAGRWPAALALVAAILALRQVYARARARVKAAACDGCEHLGQGVCPGFRLQAEALRRVDAQWQGEPPAPPA